MAPNHDSDPEDSDFAGHPVVGPDDDDGLSLHQDLGSETHPRELTEDRVGDDGDGDTAILVDGVVQTPRDEVRLDDVEG